MQLRLCQSTYLCCWVSQNVVRLWQSLKKIWRIGIVLVLVWVILQCLLSVSSGYLGGGGWGGDDMENRQGWNFSSYQLWWLLWVILAERRGTVYNYSSTGKMGWWWIQTPILAEHGSLALAQASRMLPEPFTSAHTRRRKRKLVVLNLPLGDLYSLIPQWTVPKEKLIPFPPWFQGVYHKDQPSIHNNTVRPANCHSFRVTLTPFDTMSLSHSHGSMQMSL